MAIKDVKVYFYNMLGQYLEMKEDLKDFDQALKDGHITEDKLIDVTKDVEDLQANYHRISYILYLLELPKRKDKKTKYKKSNLVMEKYFADNNADMNAVIKENESILTHLRAELKKLSEEEK